MADNKNQHYVPQHYFKFFSGGADNICLLLRRNGNLIKSAPIKGQSSKNYFYGDASVEKQVTEIESGFIPTLRKLRGMEDLTNFSREDHEFLVQSLMFQRARTLAARADMQPIADKFTRLFVEIQINKDEAISEELREQLRDALPFLVANPEVHQGMRMAISVATAHELLDLECVLLKNKTSRPFVFGDAPVVFTNLAQRKVVSRGVLGAKTPGLVVYYPVGPFESVMLFDRMVYDVKGVRSGKVNVRDLRDVEQLNKLQIHASASAVYFHDFQYAEYVKYLWDGVGADQVGARGKIAEFEVEDEREILISYERQLPFFPSLSFLSYPVFSANSFFYDRDSFPGVGAL